MSSPARILLIGMMGAGKSTVGPILATRLGWDYIDSDEQVERAGGRTVAEIWRAEGEAAFRIEEAKALNEACATTKPAVISVAGGAVLDPANRARIKDAGTVVWLRADPHTLAGRVAHDAGRPLLGADPHADLERLNAERRPYYEELADEVIDTDAHGLEATVEAILSALRLNQNGGPET